MEARRLLGVFAHPDDETFCAGGTFAKYAAAGCGVAVVSATRGEAGQIRDAGPATRRTLGEVRERELAAACKELGVDVARCLDYTDGTLADVDFEDLVGAVVALFDEHRPDVVITFGDDGAYGHPDHVTISHATTEAFARTLAPSGTARLYHSHFPRSRLLILDRLAHWLVQLGERFKGPEDFVQALSLFAQETTTMRVAGDHVDVQWWPRGLYVVEQGEPATSLYLILSGEVDVVQESPEGDMEHLRRMGPGEFFGELGVAAGAPRSANVVAATSVTCLVFSSDAPTAYAGRGAGARLLGQAASDDGIVATTVIDVADFVERKVAALAAHRTQYPIDPDMFPPAMLTEMFGREHFVRVHPPEADLVP